MAVRNGRDVPSADVPSDDEPDRRVDRVEAGWRRERPDIDVGSVGIVHPDLADRPVTWTGTASSAWRRSAPTGSRSTSSPCSAARALPTAGRPESCRTPR